MTDTPGGGTQGASQAGTPGELPLLSPNFISGVHSAVLVAMEGLDVPAWQRALILALAESIDVTPRSGAVRELRLLMKDIDAVTPSASDPADELAKRRRYRRAGVR